MYRSSYHTSFVKSGILTDGTLKNVKNDSSDDSQSEDDSEQSGAMDDDTLFKACGGLTAHKCVKLIN